MDLYIYYTVDPVAATDAALRVTALQRFVGSAYDITTRLKRRIDGIDALQTWMEIYVEVPTGFDQVIAQAAAERGVDELIHGTRHVEYFVDLAPCA